MRLRLLTALVVLALTGLIAPSPVSASVSTPYALDDVDNVNLPKGDIVAIRVHVAPAKVVWTITLRRGVNVADSPVWGIASASRIDIPMDTEGGGAPDFNIELEGGVFGANSSVADLRPGGSDSCPDPAVDQPGNLRTIRIRMSRSCMDNPAQLRGRITYKYDAGGDGSVDSTDRAPDGGFTPQVVGAPPSAG